MAYVTIAFFGRYRPAHYEAETVEAALKAARDAVKFCEPVTRDKVRDWIKGLERDAKHDSYTSASAEHGGLCVAWRRDKRDDFLDAITATLPAFPGLRYA